MISTSKAGLKIPKTSDLTEGRCVLEWKTNVVSEEVSIVFSWKESNNQEENRSIQAFHALSYWGEMNYKNIHYKEEHF